MTYPPLHHYRDAMSANSAMAVLLAYWSMTWWRDDTKAVWALDCATRRGIVFG